MLIVVRTEGAFRQCSGSDCVGLRGAACSLALYPCAGVTWFEALTTYPSCPRVRAGSVPVSEFDLTHIACSLSMPRPQVVHSKFSDILPKDVVEDDDSLRRPDAEEIEAATEETRLKLEKIVQVCTGRKGFGKMGAKMSVAAAHGLLMARNVCIPLSSYCFHFRARLLPLRTCRTSSPAYLSHHMHVFTLAGLISTFRARLLRLLPCALRRSRGLRSTSATPRRSKGRSLRAGHRSASSRWWRCPQTPWSPLSSSTRRCAPL